MNHAPPNKRTAPVEEGPAAGTKKQLRPHFDSLTYSEVQNLLTEALDCERYLARRQYRLRQFILNCKVYLDHLDALSDALSERRAA